MRDLKRIILHHSGSLRDKTTMLMMRKWHMDKGWSDIGYHHVIEGDGRHVYGRPLEIVGAHCKGENEDSVGICVTGDNTDIAQQWTMTQIDKLLRVVDSYRFVFPGIEVSGHKDHRPTECPGLDAKNVLGDSIWQG